MTQVDMHIHSNFSDGKNSPEEIVKAAVKKNLKVICIVDHVWKTSDWVKTFKNEIDRLKKKYKDKIIIYSGLETKAVNQNGELDITPAQADRVDLIFATVHRIPSNRGKYLTKKEINKNPKYAVDCWLETTIGIINKADFDILAHPTGTLYTKRLQPTEEQFISLLNNLKKKNKYFELNKRYPLSDEFMQLLENFDISISIGSDAHEVEEIGYRIDNTNLVSKINNYRLGR